MSTYSPTRAYRLVALLLTASLLLSSAGVAHATPPDGETTQIYLPLVQNNGNSTTALTPVTETQSPAVPVTAAGTEPKLRSFPVLPDQAIHAAHDDATLDIAPGAVTETVTITVSSLLQEELPPLDQGMTNVTQGARRGYRFLPHRKFQNKLTVRMPYSPGAIPPGMTEQDIRTFYFDEELGAWQQLERVEVDVKNRVVTSLTDHFTDMINATVTVPDHPEAAAHMPTSLKELAAADPGDAVNLIETPQADHTGDARLAYPIEVPPGRAGVQPSLALRYNSGGGNGWLGQGWNLSTSAIVIDTRWGVPRYDLNEETESYLLDGEQLTPLAHRGALQPRTAEKVFQTRSESMFRRIIRHGDRPDNYTWEVIDKSGTRYFYGNAPDTFLTDGVSKANDPAAPQNIYRWMLHEVRDPNGNGMVYTYAYVEDAGSSTPDALPGSQLYLKRINYTQSNGQPGAYSVTFVRDRELPNFVRRADVQIDARGGFKMVTADLLKQIVVTFNGAAVRQYDLNYQSGAFHKTLLQSVAQRGEDGALFNTHTFTYYDEIRNASGLYQGFEGATSWATGNGDNIGVDLLGFGQASALGGSVNDSFGVHLYAGFSATTPTKQFSAGGKLGSVDSDSESVLALIDLNGDQLPDKVFKEGNNFFFRLNSSGPSGGTTFGAPIALATLPAIARESSSTLSFGLEGYYVVSALANTAETFSSGIAYFNDVNGDGLIDMVLGGRVYFNHLEYDANLDIDIPTFTLNDSSQTPAPIPNGVVDADGIVQDYSDLYEQAIDKFPLHDTLRRWTAPFNGTVRITGNVALIEDTSQLRAQYESADGVRVAIQKNGSELWSNVFAATDYTPTTPTGLDSVAVTAGDRLYFRVQSIFDGAYDQVSWDPRIEYTNFSTTVDANNLNPLVYQASADFVMAGRRDVFAGMPFTGTVHLTSDLVKLGQTSDDITLQVYQNENLIFSQTQTWDATGAIPLALDIPVLAQDAIRLRVQVDSPIDVQQIQWAPELYYTAAAGVGKIFDDDGNPLFQLNPPYDVDLYPVDNLSVPQMPWTAPMSGTVTVEADLNALFDANGLVTFTAKRDGALAAKEQIAIVDGVAIGGQLTFAVNADDQIFFDFSVYDPDLGIRVTDAQAKLVNTNDDSRTPVPSALHRADRQNVFPQAYRGWAAAGYNGNRALANQSIDESRLVQTFDEDSTYDPSTAPVYLFNPFPAANMWRGPDDGGYVTGNVMSSSRLGPDTIAVPREDDFAGNRGVVRLSRTRQDAIQLGIGPFSGAASGYDPQRGDTYSEVDFMDMNGDGYPDILGNNRIQYSTPDGGLEPVSEEIAGFGYVRQSDARSRNLSIGGSAPLFKSNAKGVVDAAGHHHPGENSTGSQMVTLGFGLGVSLGDGDSAVVRDLQDMNGDGLPDRVVQEGSVLKVALNLGYRFAELETWGQGVIHEGGSTNQALSANLGILGYNDGIYGFAGGNSLTHSESETDQTLTDVNGDGLLDRIRWNGNGLSVALNLGNAFAPEIEWHGALSEGLAKDSSVGLGSGVYFTIGVGPLCLFACYVILNPGADLSQSMARPEVSLRDVDGDGNVDHLFSDADSGMTVARNRTDRTNLLKSVERPLGANFVIEYERSGNTIDQPSSRWVMSKVSIFDGHVGDGADIQATAYHYEDGFYDRQEREFYGYGRVIQEQLDTENGYAIYRVVESEYFNDSFYTQGLSKRVTVMDNAGHQFEETVHTYTLRDVNTGVEPADGNSTTATLFVQPTRTETNFYEGQAAPGKSTFVSYKYDEFGNVSELFDAGDSGTQDDVLATFAYSSSDAACVANQIIGEPTAISVLGNGVLMRQRASTVDCNSGNVTQVREYLANGQAAVTDLAYDTKGNLQQVTGPVNQNGQRFQLSYTYDPVVENYVTQITDSYGYISTAAYNFKYGKKISQVDINGNEISYTLDQVGRLRSVTGPYEQGGPVATIRYEYHPEATPPWARTRHLDPLRDPSGSDTMDKVSFIDGLKRSIQTKQDTTIYTGADSAPEDVMSVSGRSIFDAFSRVVEQYYPTVEALGAATVFNPAFDSVQPTLATYDVLGRITKTTIPDGTSVTTEFGFGNDRNGVKQFVATQTDANGIPKKLYRNVRQQLVAVQEFNQGGAQVIWTSYGYDPLQQLVQVVDDQNNITTMNYDNFGRRTATESPDTGLIEYGYDLSSNQIAKITPNLRAEGKQISYLYDFNRLTETRYPDFPGNNVTMHYGGPGAAENRAGRITEISDQSGREERFYGKLGEIVREVKTIASDTQGADPEVYTTEYTYDTWNRLHTLRYPDGEVLTYAYDSGGSVNQVSGVKGNYSYAYVNRLEYDKFGDRVFSEAGNNVRTTYTYDAETRRLAVLQTGKGDGNPFQNLAYEFDNMGNVLGVANLVSVSPANQMGGPTSQRFTYDDLYRLTHAEGSYEYAPGKSNRYVFDQSYDTLHNIVSKNQSHEIVQSSDVAVAQQKTTYGFSYSYGSSRPRAVTHVGERTFHYDANGNQIGWTHDVNGTQRNVIFDEENRVQGILDNGHEQRYKYNYAGERVIKRGPQGEAVYVNPYFSIRNREIGTKHVFVGFTRIVSKLMKQEKPGGSNNGQQAQEKDLYFYHPDHLGGTNFVTEASGQLYEHLEYFPFGESWVDESSNIQRTPYLFTGKELDEETGLYYYGARYYDPRIGSFISTDPLYGEEPDRGVAQPNRLNLYAYAVNNPVRYNDPDGREPADGIHKIDGKTNRAIQDLLNVAFQLIQEGHHETGLSYLTAIVHVTAQSYGIDIKAAGSLRFDPNLKKQGNTTLHGAVTIGPTSLIATGDTLSTALLATVILHEMVHVGQMKVHREKGRRADNEVIQVIDEIEAYKYQADHAEDLGASAEEIKLIKANETKLREAMDKATFTGAAKVKTAVREHRFEDARDEVDQLIRDGWLE